MAQTNDSPYQSATQVRTFRKGQDFWLEGRQAFRAEQAGWIRCTGRTCGTTESAVALCAIRILPGTDIVEPVDG
jgi:hypothetical protein